MRVVNIQGTAILDASGRLEGPVIHEGSTLECVTVSRAINRDVDRLVYSAERQRIEYRAGKNSEEGKMYALLLGLPASYPQVITAAWLLDWGCALNEAINFAQLA